MPTSQKERKKIAGWGGEKIRRKKVALEMQTSAGVLMVWHVRRCWGTGPSQHVHVLRWCSIMFKGLFLPPCSPLGPPTSTWGVDAQATWVDGLTPCLLSEDLPLQSELGMNIRFFTCTPWLGPSSQACCQSLSCSHGRGAVTHLWAGLLRRPGHSAKAAERADVGARPWGRSAPSLLPALWTKLSKQYRWPTWAPITTEQGAGTLAVPSLQPVGHWGQVPGSHVSFRAALKFPHPGKK